ncbi:MAG: sensor domain-containing diguanylate cyclase [Acidimicrobiales bacterium]|nr:sensor domain-containing diguanylate cyclase [Acidimicrobiales bacterium]
MPGFTTDLGRIAVELPDAIVILEPDGAISWVNHAAVDLIKLDPATWLGRSVFELLHEDDHAIAFAAFEGVATQERGSLIDVRVKDGLGAWRQLEIRGRMVPAGDGDDGFIVVVLRDVADRQQLELGGGNPEQLRALVHHATSLLVTLDEEGRILRANAELSRMLHHDLALVAGEPFEMLVEANDRALVRGAMLRSERTERLEARMIRPDGELVTVDLSITDLRNDPLVAAYVVSATDITDLKTTQQALRHMADHDGLTGLLSRRALLAKLDDFVDDGFQNEIVVLFCDLDGFKAVNDRIGHAAGDQVLVEVARRLERSLRPGDLVGRLGGDEFVVVLPRADEAIRDEVSDRIRAALSESIFAGDQLVEVGVSIGSAMTGDHPTAARLLATADDAMYEVKRSTRGA